MVEETKSNFLLDHQLNSNYSSLSNRLSSAQAVNPGAAVTNFNATKGAPENYMANRFSPEALKQSSNLTTVNSMFDLPEHNDLWNNQSFMDMSSPYMQNVTDRLNAAKEIPKPFKHDGHGLLETFKAKAMGAYLSSSRGQSVIDGDIDSELRIMKRQDEIPEIDTTGFFPTLFGGAGEIAGSVVSSVPEIARNQVALKGISTALKLHPRTRAVGEALEAGRVGAAASNFASAEAIFEDTAKSIAGNELRNIQKIFPNMPPEEQLARANAIGRMSGAVESLGVMIGLPQSVLRGYRTVVGNMIRKGSMKPAIAENPNLLSKVLELVKASVSVGAKATVTTIEELSEEKLQDLIAEAGSIIEGSDDIYTKLATHSIGEFGKDALNIMNPNEELSARNQEFLKNMHDVGAAMFVGSFLGIAGGRSSSRNSDGTKVDKTDTQRNLEDLQSAVGQQQTLVESVRKLKEISAGGNLPVEAEAMLDKSMDGKTSVSMEAQAFIEMSEKIVNNESLPVEEQARLKAIFSQMTETALESVKNGTKVDVNSEIMTEVFNTDEAIFNQFLDDISVGDGGFSKNDFDEMTKDRFTEKQIEINQSIEEDFVYKQILETAADDVNLPSDQKQTVAATVQIMFQGMTTFTGSEKTTRKIWEDTGVAVKLAAERISEDRTTFRKILDKIKGVDFKEADPAKIAVNLAKAQKTETAVATAPSIRRQIKSAKNKVSRSEIDRVFDKPKTVSQIITSFGGIQPLDKHTKKPLTHSEMENLKQAVKKSKGTKGLTEFFRRELVDSLGENLARRHIKVGGASLNDLAEAFHAEGFFPEGLEVENVSEDHVFELLTDVTAFNPDVQAYVVSKELENKEFVESFELDDINEDSSDAEIAKVLETRAKFAAEADLEIEAGNEAEVDDEGVPFFQKGDDQVVGGRFHAASNLIEIAKDGNATTYIHEFGHFWLAELERVVLSGEATEAWVKNYEKLRKWSGAVDGPMNAKVNEAANEKFISGFQTYLATGKAPISGLADLFAHLKDIFMSVYGSLKRSGVPINKEITKVYDQMFASAEDVQKANKANGNKVIARPDGVSDAFYDSYMTEQVKGNAIASNKVYRQRLQDIDRLDSETMKELEQKIRADVTKAIEADPDYILLAATEAEKLNIQSMKDHGLDIKLLRSNLKSKDGGRDVVQFASEQGFKSVGLMVDVLSRTPKKKDMIDFTVEESMKKALTSIDGRETPMAAATDRNYFAATIRKAMMFGKRDEAEFNHIKNTVIKSATDGFLKTNMKKAIKTKVWRDSLLRHNVNATQAFNTGNTKSAYNNGIYAAISQLNSEFAIIAIEIHKRFQKTIGAINGSQNQRRNLGQGNYDAIAAVINNFGLKKVPTTSEQSVGDLVDSFINRMVKDVGLQDIQALSSYKAFLVKGGNFKDLSYRDYSVLAEILTKMIKASKKSRIIERENEKFTNAGEMELITNQKIAIKMKEGSHGVQNAIAKLYLNVTSIPTLIHDTFGDHFVDKYLLPFKQGMDRANSFKEKKLEELSDVMKKHNVVFTNKTVYVEGVMDMTVENLFIASLNIISDTHNRENYFRTVAEHITTKKGANLTNDQKQAIIKAIPENVYEAANDVIQEVYAPVYTPLRQAIQSRTGIAIEKVEGTPFKSPFGKTYKGGYYPASKSIAKVEINLDPTKAGVSLFGVHSSGITKERTQAITGDLDLTSRTMVRSFYNMSMQLHVLEAHNNIGKILKNHLQLKKHLGDYAYSEINQWHKEAIQPNAVGKHFAALDGAFKVFVLGGRVTTAMIQLLGVIPAAAIIGPQWVVPAIGKFVSDPRNIVGTITKAAKKSEYMNRRLSNSNLSVIFGALESEPEMKTAVAKYGERARFYAMYMIAYMDAIASSISWDAEFAKRKSEGMDDKKAVLRADEAVRQTQGDFSKYAKPKAMSGYMSLITPFMTYFFAMGSKIFSNLVAGNKAKAFGLTFAVVVVSPILEAMVRESLAEDDDDEGYFERASNRAMMQMAGTAGNIIMPVGGLGGSVPKILIDGWSYSNEIPFVQVAKSAALGIRAVGMLSLEAVGVEVKGEKDTTLSLGFDIVRGVGATKGVFPKSVVDTFEKFLEEQ